MAIYNQLILNEYVPIEQAATVSSQTIAIALE